MNRRELLNRGANAAAGLSLLVPAHLLAQAGGSAFRLDAPLVPLIARRDRLFRVTVCLRPFRAAGPRIEVEQVGRKHVVHHYGHGGSGWSLSWGSALEAVPLALQAGQRDIAVIGAGAIGLTTAVTAQRLGAKVTIYAKERFPDVRSARATGGWTPDSRIAMASGAGPDFATRWERMTRAAFAHHQSFLGLAGNPVEWTEQYVLRDAPHVPEAPPAGDHFLTLQDRVRDLTPQSVLLTPGTHPFATPIVEQSSTLTFNVADLARQLEADFLAAGGRFVVAELHEPADFGRIREKTIINCTGYGARALCRDDSVVPVRGQIAWLIPQPGFDYSVRYRHLSIRGRRDGIVVQPLGDNDFFGFNDDNETPDYPAAFAAVDEAAGIFDRG